MKGEVYTACAAADVTGGDELLEAASEGTVWVSEVDVDSEATAVGNEEAAALPRVKYVCVEVSAIIERTETGEYFI